MIELLAEGFQLHSGTAAMALLRVPSRRISFAFIVIFPVALTTGTRGGRRRSGV